MNEELDIAALQAGKKDGHVGAIGLRYVEHGQDWAELAMDYDTRLVINPATGVLASGAIISLIDSACGLAIIARNREQVPMATLDLRIDYMRAAIPGRAIIARGTCYKVTRRVAFVRCEAHDGDPADIIAHASGTFLFTSGA